MIRYILAIDDDPIRYNNFNYMFNEKLFNKQVISHKQDITCLFVSCRLEEVKFYLENYKISGILLDHDMPFQNGLYFADTFLKERSIPVAIVSHNPDGAIKIKELLDEYYVKNVIAKVVSNDSSQYINWLKTIYNNFYGE